MPEFVKLQSYKIVI